MAEQKESSVLFSLKELMSIEENRIKEEEDAKKRQAEMEVQARADAERRAREDEEARLRAEEERRRQDELRRRMEEAQVEAAKASEIEKRKLEDQHRLQMEALSRQQAHEREIHTIQSQKRKGIHPGVIGGVGVAFAAALIAVVYFVSIKPSADAKEAIHRAATFAESDESSQWDEADRQLAIARDKDPTNKDIVPVAEKVQTKRDKLKAEMAKKDAEREALLKKLQTDLSSAQDSLATAKTDAEKKAAQDKLDRAKSAIGGVVAGGGGAKAGGGGAKPPCPPGVPLCNN